MTLPDSVSFIIEKLEEHGYEAYAVGGCVRDAMLGREPEDWDITTSAKPLEVKALFHKTIDTGLQHGTVTVMVKNVGYEVTTYRIDGEYEDGRHPKEVAFTTNLRMDLERRDFTINAMAYNDREGLVDAFDGVGDLQKGIIRCVGDAGERFDEDALRMLRAVRFSGQLGFSIEEKTRAAIESRVGNLRKISAERIRVELTKLLLSQGAEELRVAYETGMTAVFLPEWDKAMACDQKNSHHIFTVGEHSLRGVMWINRFWEGAPLPMLSDYVREKLLSICRKCSKKQHMMLVVTMLLHDIAKPDCMTIDEDGVGHFYGHPQKGAQMARCIMRRLTFDNETIHGVERLILYHDYRPEPKPKQARRAAAKIGADFIWMECLVQYADVLSQNPEKYPEKLARLEAVLHLYEQMEEEKNPLSVKDLAVGGRDLLELGVTQGPEMGSILNQLLEVVLEEPEKNTRELLGEEVQKLTGNKWCN